MSYGKVPVIKQTSQIKDDKISTGLSFVLVVMLDLVWVGSFILLAPLEISFRQNDSSTEINVLLQPICSEAYLDLFFYNFMQFGFVNSKKKIKVRKSSVIE